MGITNKPPFSIGLILNSNFIASRATTVVTLIFFYIVTYANASSGGIMGGSDWDPPSDSSSSSDDSWSHFDSYSSSYESSPFSSHHDHDHDYEIHFSDTSVSWSFLGIFSAAIMVLIIAHVFDQKNASKTSVTKVQIGLFGKIRPLQNDLNQIARTTDTSTRRGMRSVLTGTLESLIAHQKSYISAYLSSKNFWSIDEGKKLFNELSCSEQGKFDEETLVNVNNVWRERTEQIIRAADNGTCLVITILVAAQGSLQLPSINTSEDLLKALRKLLSIPESKTMAVRVLWTPQQNLDTLSYEQLLEDYPLLRPLEGLRTT